MTRETVLLVVLLGAVAVAAVIVWRRRLPPR